MNFNIIVARHRSFRVGRYDTDPEDSFLRVPKGTSINPANRMANAPTHCSNSMGSSGNKIAALIMATTTSDIVKMPTRPGNNSCDTRKMIQKQGSRKIIDQTAAVGKAVFNMLISGSGTLNNSPAKTADIAVVAIKMKVVKGRIGIVDHLLRQAMPMAQNIPDKKLKRSPMLRGCCTASPFDSKRTRPRKATQIESKRFFVRGSDNQKTPIKVNQIGVR